MRAPVILALALATGACGGSGQNQAGSAANGAEPAGSRVAALSEGERNAVFIRALRDAGLECQHVEHSLPAGRIQNLPAWRATCQGGGEWTIVIAADGSAQILPNGNPLDGNQAGAGPAAARDGP
jgi:hypothetical protein